MVPVPDTTFYHVHRQAIRPGDKAQCIVVVRTQGQANRWCKRRAGNYGKGYFWMAKASREQCGVLPVR